MPAILMTSLSASSGSYSRQLRRGGSFAGSTGSSRSGSTSSTTSSSNTSGSNTPLVWPPAAMSSEGRYCTKPPSSRTAGSTKETDRNRKRRLSNQSSPSAVMLTCDDLGYPTSSSSKTTIGDEGSLDHQLASALRRKVLITTNDGCLPISIRRWTSMAAAAASPAVDDGRPNTFSSSSRRRLMQDNDDGQGHGTVGGSGDGSWGHFVDIVW